jgi:fructose-1,6-bisphosphatase/inositol monophosphatase family enzyme
MSCVTCPSVNLEECERVAVEIARKAGKIIKDTCGKVKSVESKQSFADLVTETDQNVEKFVFAELRKSFPDHKFIGEESVAATNHGKVEFTDEPTWIVDPVDG